jgi:beta-galactosidase
MEMKRRDFIKAGISSVALAALPGCTTPLGIGAPDKPSKPVGDLKRLTTPRRCELLDFDWRFKAIPEAKLEAQVPITEWTWTRELPGQTVEMMTQTELDTSAPNWETAPADKARMKFIGHAWFRTNLPEIAGPGRAVSFEYVVNVCDVYLNGRLVASRQGWPAPFTVKLDTAWNAKGPNVLAVRVEHYGNWSGGISGRVLCGRLSTFAGAETDFLPPLDDGGWREIQLPHDYIIEGEYTPEANTSHGSLPVFPAWYRKTFLLDSKDRGKCVWLYFEGVFRDAKIYLNGKLVGRHASGYTSFHVDLTEEVHFDQPNQLTIHVDPTHFEGWWYEGGGIYRHVWLNIADRIHVAPWGVYVMSDISGVLDQPAAQLTIETLVSNRSSSNQSCSITSTILDPNGKMVGVACDTSIIPPNETSPSFSKTPQYAENIDQPSSLHSGTKVRQSVSLISAMLWSLETPNRYTLLSEVKCAGRVVDRHVQKFGIRTLRFDSNEGFFLNEKPVKLQGACNHQDFIGVGNGVPDSLFYYRMKTLKSYGCNAIRSSSNLMAPAMYEACDELGLLVMDENRYPGSSVAGKSWEGQPYDNTWHVESMVLRDRNYPCVIMWCMWNEEVAIQNKPYGREMMTALMKAVRKHDSTRPVTCANNGRAQNQGWRGGAAEVEDILGVNYNIPNYDILHAEFPGKMIFGSEIGGEGECRGIYETDKAAAHLTSYMSPHKKWEPIASRKFVAGGFYWTGFDYWGETTPFEWPAISSNFGFLDMCGFPKDAAYYWKAWWKRDVPLVHIFPHWNWPGKEGQNIPVWCFSNCDEVELFLNGRSLGRQQMPQFGHLQWDQVRYEPGNLEAKGYIKGVLVTTKLVATSGTPAAIRLIPDRLRLISDGQDTVPIAVVILDAEGRTVPTANNRVTFTVSGAGTNSGVGNGDPSCHEPNQSSHRSAFNGYCMLLVRASRSPGEILVTAQSPGLSPHSVHLSVQSA